MNFKLDKDLLKKGAKIGLRVTKSVAIEGVKALALKTAAQAITGAFEGKKVTEITLDDVLGEEKKKNTSKGWFSKEKKEDTVVELIDDLERLERLEKDEIKNVIES